MPRKIFLSFLGAIPYYPTQYYWPDQRSQLSGPVYYVQGPILEKHRVDKALIFTTDSAAVNNYRGRIERVGKTFTVQEGEGIESVLQALSEEGRLPDYDAVEIPNGYSESEIWTVFQRVYNELDEGDHVILDITFGFRSLPMLVMVLLNYARILKGISIKAIYYGNYEAGRAEKEALQAQAKDPQEKQAIARRVIEAPILDLQAFSVLQEWVQAAQSFEDGNAIALAKVLNQDQADLGNSLLAFTQAIQACRGQALIRDINVDALKETIVALSRKSDIEAQLKPLLQKMLGKLSPFSSQQLQNGFAAVEWCIQHDMIQQGITFLQETLQSLVIEQVCDKAFITNRMYRTAANGALYGFKSPKRSLKVRDDLELPLADEDVVDICRSMYRWVKSYEGLRSAYNKLSGDFRNDINHCGYRDDYQSSGALKIELNKLYHEIKGILNYS